VVPAVRLAAGRRVSIMTRLHIDGGGDLVVRLPWRWAPTGRRRTAHLPLECVDEVRVEPHWWRAVCPHPGCRYRLRPGRWCVGELEHARGRGLRRPERPGPVLVVTTFGHDAPYARLASSTSDPEADGARLRPATVSNAPKKLSR